MTSACSIGVVRLRFVPFFLLAAFLTAACSVTPDWAAPGKGPAAEVEEAEEQTQTYVTRIRELDRAERERTLGVTERVRSRPRAGWAGERIWHRRANDWEPTLAADPSSPYVYQLTTRYGKAACGACPDPWIVFRSSADGGQTWSADQPLCECKNGRPQYDPQIEVAEDGTIFAAWVDSVNPGVAFTRSSDRGRTWSRPIHLHDDLAFSDRPVLTVSADGEHVYIAFHAGDSYVVSSHDGGQTFSRPVRTNRDRRLHFAGSGYVGPDGTVTFAQSSYHRSAREIRHEQPTLKRVRVLTVSSRDGGRTWRRQTLDSFREPPPCTSQSCPRHYYGPQAVVAGDADGDLVLVANGTLQSGGEQRIFVRRSRNAGSTWSKRRPVSPKGANAVFPAVVGTQNGDFRLWFMDDRTGSWNVWYRRSANGGRKWGRTIRISDATSGTAYKARDGFREPYGDYGEIAVMSTGGTIAVWGEGSSYAGPGGTWFNRQRG